MIPQPPQAVSMPLILPIVPGCPADRPHPGAIFGIQTTVHLCTIKRAVPDGADSLHDEQA